MNLGWPTVALGEVLRRSERMIALDPETLYKEVTVRMNGKGVVERRLVQGIEIASDRRYEARAGQFIISRIDARHGASGLIPNELDLAVVTNDFPLFDVAKDRLDPSFLSWMSKTSSFVELCKQASEGTTNRVRLSEERFKALQIPLPPLEEQRRIVARVGKLATKLEEALRTRSALKVERQALLRSTVTHYLTRTSCVDPDFVLPDCGQSTRRGVEIPKAINLVAAAWSVPSGWKRVSIAELLLRGVLLDVKDGNHGANHPKSSEFTDRGTPFLMASDLVEDHVDWKGANRLPLEAQSRLRIGFSKAGDVLFTHKASIGKTALSDRDSILSPQVTYYRCNKEFLEPGWLKEFLGSDLFLNQLSGIQQQSTRDFVSISKQYQQFVLLPPLAAQKRIAKQLNHFRDKVSALKELQSETTTELEAMLPTILDRAFKGHL